MSTKPFTLTAPKAVYYHGKLCWSPSVEHMVEYNLWQAGQPIMVGHLQAIIEGRFRTKLSSSYIGQILRSLCVQDKARRLARGLYVHPQVMPDPRLEEMFT